MKILLVNIYYYPNMIGGTEHSIKILAENLVKAGHQVYVYALDGHSNKSFFQPEIINGVTVYRGWLTSAYKLANNLNRSLWDKIKGRILSFYNPVANKQLKAIITNIKPDVIHTQNMVSISYWIWHYAVCNHIRVVHTIRDYWLLDPKTVLNGSSRMITMLHRCYFKKISNRDRFIITSPSKKTLFIFQQHGYFKKCLKRCVVNCVEFDEEQLNYWLREKQNRTDDIIHFLYVGALGEYKGIKLLLDVFKQLRMPNISLTICGSGPLKDTVSAAAKNDSRIVYKGQLNSESLALQYQAADVLIVPSIWDEPFGRIVIEGAKYGLPCIGSNRGGIPEIINNLQDGVIFDPAKPEKLVDAIKYFFNRANIKEYLPNIKENINRYSSEKQTREFLKLYSSRINI